MNGKANPRSLIDKDFPTERAHLSICCVSVVRNQDHWYGQARHTPSGFMSSVQVNSARSRPDSSLIIAYRYASSSERSSMTIGMPTITAPTFSDCGVGGTCRPLFRGLRAYDLPSLQL